MSDHCENCAPEFVSCWNDSQKCRRRPLELSPALCSEEKLILFNDSKIRVCNFFRAMQDHLGTCEGCCVYIYHGDGDLCERGKTILARALAFTDMSVEVSLNERTDLLPPTATVADTKNL